MFLVPQSETCFVSSLWHLEFGGGFQIFGKFVHPSFKVLLNGFPGRIEKNQEKLVKRES